MNDKMSREDESLQDDVSSNSTRLMLSGEKRRQLLRAAASGGVLVSAGVPLAAQATTRPHCKKAGSTQKYHASASAVGSVIGSTTGTDTPKYGHPCSHYQSSGNWPSGCTNGQTNPVVMTYANCANASYTGTKLCFFNVFAFSSVPTTGNASKTCAEILANPSWDEAVWLCAMLNANKLNSTGSFPYSPSQVVDLYYSKNPQLGGMVQSGLNDKARDLFKDYLSQGVPA